MPAFMRTLDLPTIFVGVILAAGGAVRFYYSDANSYWLDELYSVYLYGIENESAFAAVERLARSIHPPLYQFLLYNWMAVFGDGETATRSLSNLFIVGATLCFYLSVRVIYGAWLGVAVALVFTLMYTPTYYGMEARSYALTIFLSSLSTLLMIHALPRIVEKSLRHMATDGWVLAFLVANTALLMTHYYNVLFLGAQGLFLIIYLLWRGAMPVQAILKSFAVGLVPIIVLLAVWGPVMAGSYEKFSGSYDVDGLPMAPWDVLQDLIVRWNFPGIEMVYTVLGLVGLLAVWTLVRLARHPSEDSLFTLWFLLAAVGPALLAFLLFFVAGHERYSNRYFTFSVGPFAVLVVLSLYRIAQLVRRVGRLPDWVALVLAAICAAALAAPGGLYALEREKQDWRGIAKAVVERVRLEPDKDFAIYETVFKSSTLDYYLARHSDDVRVYDVLKRHPEKRKRPIEFEAPDADYAVIVFTHHKPSHFPKTLQAMKDSMTLSETRLNTTDRGYVVFSTRTD